MMDYDGVDYERLVFLLVLLEDEDLLIGGQDWYEQFIGFEFFEKVQSALAYMTHFDRDIVEGLRELAQ